jgi:hypothetical protein
MSGVCAPAEAIHSVAEAALVANPAKRAATANEAARLDMFWCSSFIANPS